MKNCAQKTELIQLVATTVAIIATLWIGGCEDLLTGKTTGQESAKIINELGKFEPTPEPNIPIPQSYKEPPKIIEQTVGGEKEWKLFYFCKYHVSEELKNLVHQQFATKLFKDPKKNKVISVPDYTVSSNPATNQLIVRCPTIDDVNSVLEFLESVDVPPIQVKIDCIISEVYADKTLDWSTTLLIEELFGEGIWAGPAAQKLGTSIRDLLTEPDILPSFPGASIREIIRARMGLKVGYSTNKYLALVDILESQGYLKILMNPTLEVVNGKTAKVSASQRVPLQEITTVAPQTEYIQAQTEYIDIIDSLEITPHVFADGSIGLETKIQLGSKLTPEGVKQLPIVTKKEIQNKENRIRRGESLVIGGIRKTEKRDVVRGIPVLKDIPVAGILFSGRDFEERVVETIFILTPHISTGGIPNIEMVEDIKRKQSDLTSSESRAVSAPLGFNAIKKQYERKIAQNEYIKKQDNAEETSEDTPATETENVKAETEKSSPATHIAKTETEKTNEEPEEKSEKTKTKDDKSLTDTDKV